MGDSVSNLNCLTSDSFDGEPYSFIAHSLGGVVALRLAVGDEPVERNFNMSSPFDGSKAATMLNMAFSLTPVLADINPLGSTIRSVRQDEITVPIRSVVMSSGGTPLMHEPSDGVVSVASQTCLKGPDYHRADFSHFEVLLAR
jgi:hypothetical protein